MTAVQINLPIERLVLAAAMGVDGWIDVLRSDHGLSESVFTSDLHRSVWRLLVDRVEHGIGDSDVALLHHALVSKPDLIVGGLSSAEVMAGIRDIASAPAAANVEHATALVDMARRRGLSSAHREALRALEQPHAPVDATVDAFDRRVAQIESSGAARETVSLHDAFHEELPGLEDPTQRTRYPTGIRALDDLIGGLEPGWLVTVAGRPSMGKSIVGLMLAGSVARATDRTVLHISLEMTTRELVIRHAASGSTTSASALDGKDLRRHSTINWEAVMNVFDHPSAGRIVVNRSQVLTIDDVVRIARSHHRRSPLGLLTVDYIGLLKAVGDAPRHQQIGSISRRLKLLAGQLDCPIVAVSQLNREAERRMEKRPVLSDLRESGDVEQDSNVVILVYRPEMYNATERPGEAELIVAKNRSGRLGTAHVNFQGEYARFLDKSTNGVPYPEYTQGQAA
ncbi:replicative DNA helicase [Patulibacter defluvii]|uniref:replicative DNA helicase n=1 Tax=Patulibacter defluvii TaxID=3095358 RepID=UPI002A76548E|nr:DnaB-like helicase C-terminal domain-containing protein [Patulibacter sp. DM4]